MSNFVFLNIGHDLGHLILQLIESLNRVRKETPQLKLILWPVVYSLTVAKVITFYLANGATIITTEGRGIPWLIKTMYKGLFSVTPNSIYCFNKTGFLIFFLDMYFM